MPSPLQYYAEYSAVVNCRMQQNLCLETIRGVLSHRSIAQRARKDCEIVVLAHHMYGMPSTARPGVTAVAA